MDKLMGDYNHCTAKTGDEFDFVSGCAVHKTHVVVSPRVVVEEVAGRRVGIAHHGGMWSVFFSA